MCTHLQLLSSHLVLQESCRKMFLKFRLLFLKHASLTYSAPKKIIYMTSILLFQSTNEKQHNQLCNGKRKARVCLDSLYIYISSGMFHYEVVWNTTRGI